jgi:hypothetical protein
MRLGQAVFDARPLTCLRVPALTKNELPLLDVFQLALKER